MEIWKQWVCLDESKLCLLGNIHRFFYTWGRTRELGRTWPAVRKDKNTPEMWLKYQGTELRIRKELVGLGEGSSGNTALTKGRCILKVTDNKLD